jgi:2-oxoglutarate dehydrogenase E2 component (dihydrolipoamide succinyltransferase)
MDIIIDENVCEPGSELVISTWLVDDGDVVEVGMGICELMAEKAQIEFTTLYAGKINLIAKIEQPLKVGDIIATIEEF